MKKLALIMITTAALAACGEPSQSTADGTNRGDTPPWQGAKNSYVEKGWQAGDKSSWESQMRKRSLGQNDYSQVK